MSFMKSFFGKSKKKEEKEEPKKEANQFKRDQTRRSVHLGDRSFGAEHLSAFYQSVGHKYSRGPKSCPGGEMREGDDESIGARNEFSHKRRSNRGILLNRREERNSDYSSQDPSPMSSHFSRREREAPPRHYHSSLDESDEENMDYHVMDRIRDKLRRTEEEKMNYLEKYNEMKRYCKEERKEREKEKTRHNEVVDVLRQQNRELKNTNTLLKAEIDKWRRMDEKDRYESSFESNREMKVVSAQEFSAMRAQIDELRQLKTRLEAMPRSSFIPPPIAPYGQFPSFPNVPLPFNFQSNSTGTPSTPIVGESTHDGAGESLVDPADNSYRPFDANLSERTSQLWSDSFPFAAPPPVTETPRSENRSASTLSLHDQSVTLGDSSFRPPVPSSMPPRRISQSDTALSPPRKSSHSL